jgi:hypothetical protein
MRKHTLAAAAFLVFAGSGAAMADDDCHLPMDQWQPREAVQKMAEARGWIVRRIRVDDGCYQIRGTDENGRNIKVKVDPGSLEIVKMKREGQDHDDDDNGAQSQAAPAGTVAPPSNGLFGKGVPKAEVK